MVDSTENTGAVEANVEISEATAASDEENMTENRVHEAEEGRDNARDSGDNAENGNNEAAASDEEHMVESRGHDDEIGCENDKGGGANADIR